MEYAHGLVDRVHDAPIHRSVRLIKRWALASGSTTRILSDEGVCFHLIVTADQVTEDSRRPIGQRRH
jgi:hypothetical protein